MEYAEGTTPRVLTRPYEVLNPPTPQCAPGRRTGPSSSLPTDAKQSPVETAAADPAEDPPVILSRFQGLCTGPKQPVVPVPANAISSRFSLPSRTTPAAFNRLVTSASSAGTRSLKTRAAAVVRTRAVSMLSLSARGTPCSRLETRPAFRWRSHSRACCRAESASRGMKELRKRSSLSIPARHRLVRSSHQTIPPPTAPAPRFQLHPPWP